MDVERQLKTGIVISLEPLTKPRPDSGRTGSQVGRPHRHESRRLTPSPLAPGERPLEELGAY